MGYCYTKGGGLVCDSCDSDANVKKRHCPHTVDGLPYCPAPALCNACWEKYGKNKIHAGCKEPAAARQQEMDDERAAIDGGALIVTTAWGDWDSCVPSGFVGVLFRGKGIDAFRLIRKTDYDPGRKKYLSDYPDARIWEAPHPACFVA